MFTTRFPSLPKPLFGVSKSWKQSEGSARNPECEPERESERDSARNAAHAPERASHSSVNPRERERIVMHIDMNAFFASVEQALRPFLRGKPVLVAADPYGTPKGARSVAATASYEARAYGVKTGMPLFQALRLCPTAIIVEGDGRKYVSIALKLLEILESYTDLVEPYSIDEAFIDVTNTVHLFGDKVAIARDIKRRVREEFGITCSIGVAPNKLVAKMASDLEKPDGLVVIDRASLPDAIWDLPVDALIGVGRKRTLKLNLMGIFTIRDLALYPRENLRRAFGVIGEDLQAAAWGLDDSPVIPTTAIPDPKSVSAASTFIKDTRDRELILSALFYLAEKAATRLRRHNMRARTLGVWIRYGDFSSDGRSHRLPFPIDRFAQIWPLARQQFESVFLPPRKPVRLVGVYLGELEPAVGYDVPLFPDVARKDRVDDVVSASRERFGSRSLMRARSMIGEKVVMT